MLPTDRDVVSYVTITLNSMHVFKLQHTYFYFVFNVYVFNNMIFSILCACMMYCNEHTFCSEYVNRIKLFRASFFV